MTSRHRSVAAVMPAVCTREGAGFAVRRSFPTERLGLWDPFLLLDEMGPAELGPREAKGAPDHPHRGFETVTYMLSGELEHADSHGNRGKLGPGDVQWMTAGAGVVHSEMPSGPFFEKGGKMHGFQLWVNLPRPDKMMQPRYQEIRGADIPRATTPDGQAEVRVIAGKALGKEAVIDTRIPIVYHHWTVRPGARVTVEVPEDANAFAYVFAGRAKLGSNERIVEEAEVALFEEQGTGIRLSVAEDAEGPAELLLIGGTPIREPVARYGPFVMNTREEIVQAVRDFQEGRLGEIPAKVE